MPVEKQIIPAVSTAFTKGISKDPIKICLLPGKVILEGVCCWPGNEGLFMKAVTWFLFSNLLITEIFHVAYVMMKFTDVGDAIDAGMTVTTTMEALVRMYIILLKRDVLNKILVKIWKQFWPVNVIMEPAKRRNLSRRAKVPVLLTSIFLIASIISNCGISILPLMKHDLVLKSVFPFDWNKLYSYEIVYAWQYLSDWFVLFVVNGFDFFFVSLISVCSLQFVILQGVCRDMLSPRSKNQRTVIFGDRGESIEDKEMLGRCLEQHKILVGICKDLEDSFNKVILIQFVVSIAASCGSFLVLKVNSTQFLKIISYAIGHLSQLFYYCFVGQLLSHESNSLADAIYECDWHSPYDRNFRKALVLIIQRCQNKQRLTAIGLVDLNFESFVKILRMSFSFYTVLNKVLVERSEPSN